MYIYSPTERANSLPFSSPYPVAPVPLTNKGCRHFKMGTLHYLVFNKTFLHYASMPTYIGFRSRLEWTVCIEIHTFTEFLSTPAST